MANSLAAFATYPVPVHSSSNASLVDRYRHSDPSAFTELFARHREMVYRVCLRILGHHHDAEDAVQETFRRAALAIDRWDPQRPIEPWLATIAGNRCRTLLTRRRREVLVPSIDELPIDAVADGTASLQANRSQTNRSQANGMEVSESACGHVDGESFLMLNEWVGVAISQLPDNQRKAFQLVHQEGLSYPQAARRMGRPTGTIKTWVRRAKFFIRETFHRDAAVPADPKLSSVESNRSRRLARMIAASVASLFIAVIGYMNSPETAIISGEPIRLGASGSVSAPVVDCLPSDCPLGDCPPSDYPPSDWQFASLEAFSGAQIDFVEMESMPAGTIPVESWIEYSTPVLGEFQHGIAPVGRTLRNVIRLFSCYHETEAIDPPFNGPGLQDTPSKILTSCILPANAMPSNASGDVSLYS